MPTRLVVPLAALVVAFAAALILGLNILAECPGGPLPDIGRNVWTLVIAGAAVLLGVLAIVFAVTRRRGLALLLFFLGVGLAGGFFAALTFGQAACPGSTTVGTEGTASLTVEAPYSNTFEGSVACTLDRASGRTLNVRSEERR